MNSLEKDKNLDLVVNAFLKTMEELTNTDWLDNFIGSQGLNETQRDALKCAIMNNMSTFIPCIKNDGLTNKGVSSE